ncbi:transporter substrate-binding protein [Ferviditalea candida]|uniref:Transporter substrate-binding protein n=1 Tax=Ferviditalea candida TaxID=3108399 RepID=A0ABU5ZE16_9BACL|nr:transporter substrate-binding protein [Paenibacillaceae bacterium T2]
MTEINRNEIKIGILFSLTGTTGITERGQYQASLLAIRQINEQGGVDGKFLLPIVEDIASDPYWAAKKAEKLINIDKVAAIVGLYTSSCRKSVIPVLEQYDSLLLYPTQYEGEEQHRNIFYCGPLPNQQLLHFIPWIINNLGKSIYLIGSDYIYPRETNRHIRHLIQFHKGKIAGENYVKLGRQEFSNYLNEIKEANPDVIFSTLVGDSAIAFYQQHHHHGLKQPIASAITAETEIASIQAPYAAGHYSSFPYFSSIQSERNQAFVAAYRRTYGSENISSAMENAYNSLFLLTEALRRTKTASIDELRRVLPGLAFDAPQGKIVVDKINQHLWLNSRIGQVNEKGQFTIVWESDQPIAPVPFFKNVTIAASENKPEVESQEEIRINQELLEKHMKDFSEYRILQDISGHIPESLFVLLDGSIVFLNPSAEALLASKREAVLQVLREISSGNRDDSASVLRKEISGDLFEVSVKKSPPYVYLYFKQQGKNNFHFISKDKSRLLTRDLIGSDEKFMHAVSLTRFASRTNANVLILGESGTGKELFARAIHNESMRMNKPFIALNCAAIPRDLINAELFGYMEGAFTGAKKGGSPGKFEFANGGTLFLDEIGDMPLELQATLLRVLQEKEVTRVGGHKSIPVDVRIIAATNKNITQEIAYNGSFRSDLYFRLNVFTIELIPLRERAGDIPELAGHFIKEMSLSTGLPFKHIAAEALELLYRHSWPGNVRELNNVIERAYYLAENSSYITKEHLPQYIVQVDRVEEIKQISNERERNFYIQALVKRKGNISNTAKDLGISRTTLYRKLKEYNIKVGR